MTDTEANAVRQAYANGPYTIEDVGRMPSGDGYFDRLLGVKLGMIKEQIRGAVGLDLGCGNGVHLAAMSAEMSLGIGLDVTQSFLVAGQLRLAQASISNVRFVRGDCLRLPVADSCVDLVWSLSVLYHFRNLADVLQEIGRVLKPGGRCILDLGSRRSLNQLVATADVDAAPCVPLTVGDTLRALRDCGLHVEKRRSFQILPMWGNRPRCLWPFLWSGWPRLLRRRLFGRMLDEWISSIPLINRFAFRHVVLCRKGPC